MIENLDNIEKTLKSMEGNQSNNPTEENKNPHISYSLGYDWNRMFIDRQYRTAKQGAETQEDLELIEEEYKEDLRQLDELFGKTNDGLSEEEYRQSKNINEQLGKADEGMEI